jgi:hypothetical protein
MRYRLLLIRHTSMRCERPARCDSGAVEVAERPWIARAAYFFLRADVYRVYSGSIVVLLGKRDEMMYRKHDPSVLLALFAVSSIEEFADYTWHGTTIATAQIQRTAIQSIQHELQKQKRSVLSRTTPADLLAPPHAMQIAAIDGTLETLAHVLYQIENWLLVHGDAPVQIQRRRRHANHQAPRE